MRVSLIVPCFNEEANLEKGVLDKIGNFTKNEDRFIEAIIVDDGSRDSSKKIIKKKYLNRFLKFKLIENDHRGKASSVISGIKAAKGEYIIFSDIDLATPIEESLKLMKEAEKGAEIVIGARSSARAGAPFLRKIMASGFMIIRDLFIDLGGISDSQCGFKLFKRLSALKIIENLKVYKKTKRVTGSSVSAGFDLEFLFLAAKLGYKIREVPVVWRHVETKNVNFLNDSLETLLDILRIKYFDLTHKYK